MASEKSQNPFEDLGRHAESDDPSIPGPANTSNPSFDPPPYTTTPGPETQRSTFPPAPTSPSQRNKPIAIPAVGPSSNSAFTRAYAPILTDYNLPRESFLSFLDQLNKVVAASPPLQVLDATGGILQSVPILFPLHWIGSAVSGLANLGSQGVSKSRTDSAIRQANKDIFGPRGLKVEIAKLDALAHVANIPILDSQGKVSRQTPLLQRLLNESGDYMRENIQDLDLQQRRVKILQPWIADLELEILPWTTKSKLTRFNAALKKRNNPPQAESSADARSPAEEEETGLRKALWLIIRPLDAN
ncbi:hypothetical protein P170DRAFT_217005 [Aspergillus steynii IBT 23096]|uniref:Uncharacterized protein n=1 Tax=Aspergillus steynii IBT 23096 TaxID=1392250 RepID=A0A2I2G0W6_9EURO|nr:uncharacterized protein P170DRAFT_217005 [Aspergillus steynii IBT 23096]PLB46486.1 hypothetical protein P170DRAFT_217005 [Aspergillus steynii IBT 23096]